MGQKFSQEKIDQIINWYAQGQSSEWIGQQLNSKAQTITKYLRQANIEIRGPKKKLTEADKEEICRLYQEGAPAPDLGEKFDVSHTIILRTLQHAKIDRRSAEECHRKYSINENFFDNIDSEEKAYFLGFLYADGYNCKEGNYACLSLDHLDKEILSRFASLIYKEDPESHVKIYDRQHEGKGITATLTINSKHVCQQLEDKGCPQAKTFKLVYPDWMPEELHRHFIRGYFDGDGSTTIKYGLENGSHIKFTSTESFCFGLQKIIEDSLSIKLGVNPHTSSPVFNAEASGDRNTLLVLHWMYDESVFYLRRKRDLYLDLKNKIHLTDLFANQGTRGFSKSAVTKTKHIDTGLTFDKTLSIDNYFLTASNVEKISESERLKLVEPIFHYFRAVGWLYPDDLSDLREHYQRLVNYQVDLQTSELNNNTSLATDICKFFCHSFYASTERGKLNMIETFENDDLLKKVITNRLGLGWKTPEFFSISHKMLIQGMRSMRLVPMTSIFKPAIAKYMCSKYSQEGGTVYDYSAGFGGRMLGAAACKRKYIGVDPLTTPELIKMRDFLRLENCQLIHDVSEDFQGEANSADLVWSSPPYYDQEYYSPAVSQCYNKGEDYFYNVYWKKTLDNCRNILKPNGWFGLNVKNYPRMVSMAVEVFGPVVEEVKLKTYASHLSNLDFKYESIYMFKNKMGAG